MTTELTATAKTSSPPKNSAPKKSKAKTATKSERKKKHVNKKSSATSSSSSTAAALYSAARLQYHKLLKRRDAELNDHVWLSKEPLSFQSSYSEGGTLNGPVGPIAAADATTTTASTSTTTSTSAIATTAATSHMMESPSFLEQDVEIVHRALFRNGLSMKDVTIDAFNVLLEEARKYAMELIADAADCAVYSHGNDIITPSDLLLAKEMETEECCFSLQNVEEISIKAKEVNKIALPPIPDTCYNGIVLPDSMEDTLLNRAFDVVCRRDEDDDSIQQYENKVSSLGGSKDVKNLQSMLGSANGFTSSGVNMKENGMAAYGAKRGSKQMQILLKKSLQTQGQGQPQSHTQQPQPQPQQSHIQQPQPQPQGPAPSSQPSTSSPSSSNQNNDIQQVTTNQFPETSSDTKGGLQESVHTTTMIHDSNPNLNKDEATNHPVMNKTDKKDHNPLSQEEQLETLPDADFMDLS